MGNFCLFRHRIRAAKIKWQKFNVFKFKKLLVTVHYMHAGEVTCCYGSAVLHDSFAAAYCRAPRSCWASFVITAIDGNWTSKRGHYTCHKHNTLSPYLSNVAYHLLKASTQCLQKVEILPGKNLGVCKNKSGENLAQCCCDRFGEFFPWRNNFPL